MQKILVTGANGFAGQHLIRILKPDYQIIGIINKSNLESSGNVQYVNGNILDRGFLENLVKKYRPEKIIHLAAIAPTWSEDPENIFKINLIGTLNLYLAIAAQKKSSFDPKIVYISSAEIYGKTPNPEKISEQNLFFPANYYGTSKVAADRLSYQMSQSAKLNIVIIRPFNHTGPGQLQGFFIPDMASQIVQIENNPAQSQLMVGNLESIRDISDVRDIVEGYKKIIEIEATPGEAFNICSGAGIKIKDLLHKLLKLARKPISIKEDLKRIRPSEVPITVGDYTKFKNHTGWEPKIPLDQTLEDTLNYWRAKK